MPMTFDWLDALALPAFACDGQGRIVARNAALADFLGLDPEHGGSDAPAFVRRDGTAMAFEETPMAAALAAGAPANGELALADAQGQRRVFDAHCSLAPATGEAGGEQFVVTVLAEPAARVEGEASAAMLAAIVDSSDDAIISKRLDGTITSWNKGATRIFGYSAAEMVGQSIRRLIPDHLQHEEDDILARLGKGERIDHFETTRITKEGRAIDVSITVSPVRDRRGRLTGASKVARDITGTKRAQLVAARLAAIVDSSDDAIVSKTLDGIVTTWNAGAARIFGYSADEMVGQSITRLIPDELQWQEDDILARLARGERIDHFDTVRITKDGRAIDVSLTISPIRDGAGRVIGASKIARDVSERKRAEELQGLLIGELNHRVKNTLATVQAIASQSLRAASTPRDFVRGFSGRVQALAHAHDLLMRQNLAGATLGELVEEQVGLGAAGDARIKATGPEVTLSAGAAMNLALVLHELATNARRHGALANQAGAVTISWTVLPGDPPELRLTWRESGVGELAAPEARGFGLSLIERGLTGVGGSSRIAFADGGLQCEIRLKGIAAGACTGAARPAATRPQDSAEAADDWAGARILVIEDEPLVAMEIEAQLAASAFTVVGPAMDVAAGHRLIDSGGCDAALLDGNLGGHSVEDLARKLAVAQVPFAFVTGYGRESLPEDFRDREVVAKPFAARQLTATVRQLLAQARGK